MFNLIKLTLFAALTSSAFYTNANCNLSSPLSKNGWQNLNANCDIGAGIWSNKKAPTTGKFWLQCNYSKNIPSSKLKVKVQQLFPKNSFLIKTKDNNYRVLVGLFNSSTEALSALNTLKKHNIPAFLRLQTKDIKENKAAMQAIKKPPTAPKHLSRLKVATYNDVNNTFATNSILYSFALNGVNYYLPQHISQNDTDITFIKEHGMYWLGLNHQQAQQWCQHFGLELPTSEQLATLGKNQQLLSQHKWPKKVSFWAQERQENSASVYDFKTKRTYLTNPTSYKYATCVEN